jgi:formamidopyrimidine-DNA glycosylase
MPELPEVETIASDVRPHLVGTRIVRARVIKPDVLRGIRRPAFEGALAGRRVVAVGRRAKHVVLTVDSGARIVIQPRMTGALLVDGAGFEERGARDPYDVLELHLDSGERVHYRDVRRLGAILLLTPRAWASYDSALGPEPLEPDFTPERLAAILRRARLAVKKAIMDQRRLAGVGNIYASEALWLARIDPSRAACSIGPQAVRRLHAAIVDVLRSSIAGRGTTVRDYRTGTGEPGRYQGRLAVYGRAGQPCVACGTRIALTHAIDARATYFCHRCQH